MVGLKTDRWGYELKTSSDACVSAINSYYEQVLSYGRKRSVILEAHVHDGDCVLANVLAAHYHYPSHRSKSSFHIQAAKSRIEEATSYERAVFDAVSYLILDHRDEDVVVKLHSKLLEDFPRDLVSLKRAQVLCFYMGRPDLSLGLVNQVLPHNQQENYVYGLLAFPLLELGRMEDAEEAAKKAFEINKKDCWTHHAMCHILQYECRYQEAVQFMEECSSSWDSCSSFMLTHNWWHLALCYLEGNAPIKKVVEIYDKRIWKELEKTDAMSSEVYLSALGLLLRAHIRGVIDIFEDRLKILSSYLTDKANWYLEWHLDVLIVWALSSTGKLSSAEDLLTGLKSRLSKMSKKKQQLMQRGYTLAEALYEYGKGNENKALELLGPAFNANDCKVIGASDEQVDVFNEVWFTMLLNTGNPTKAIEVIEKQIKKREGIPFLWRMLERGYSMAGRPERVSAGEKARVLEAKYFNFNV